MTEPVPEFYSTPSTEAIHKAPAKRGGELTFPFTPQQLMEIGAELIEQFLRRVVNALAGVFIPGVDAFTQLQNWGNDVGEFIGNIFDTIRDALNDLLSAILGGVDFFNLPTPGEFWSSAVSMFNPGTIGQDLVDGLQSMLNEINDWITDIIIGIGNALDDIPIVGRDLEAALLRLFNVKQKAVTADARSAQIVEDTVSAWSGTTPTGTPTEVFDTVVSIKDAVYNGYTVVTFTTSDPAWPIPAGINVNDVIGGVIGGGGRGGHGQQGTGTQNGGPAGINGGFLSRRLDLSGLTPGTSTLAITVGAAASTAGADGGLSTIVASTGTLLESIPNSNGIATLEGYIATSSRPGSGGAGGGYTSGGNAVAGEDGESSAVAAGGQGGSPHNSGGTAGSGTAGGAGESAGNPKCGGGGGGGGGAARAGTNQFTANGGDGGNGGFPGGGSGGGGAAAAVSPSRGTAGVPGNGLVWIIYK